ncbi:YqiA/YcfP family alpha/beta fold hydrolase [Gilvimarinus sp. F26214L]|uniref:YqiA/YcfP family alpha/beta fold hydrolase n=1 Tax=Gilvimarinus sp. DZF01 TaxID=3461371 RepID=UPI00404609B7
MSLLLYIHGFLSSPLSHKAQQVESWLQENRPKVNYACPFLSAYPAEAIEQLEDIVKNAASEPVYLMGSSLGGYYATWLAEKYGLPAVLINPAVAPYELISAYLDQDLKNYHTDDHYRLGPEHIEQLRELETEELQYPARYWLMVQTGDETLDYRRAVERYKGCRQLVEQGGDHSFQNFERWLPDIHEFYTGSSADR